MEYDTLKDWATIVMGQSPKAQDVNKNGEGLPLLNGPTEFGISHPTPVQYTTNGIRIAPKGSLLFCVRGSTTGRMNWADREYAIGRGLAAIVPKNPMHKYFLRSVIESELELLLGSATGSTFPNVSSKQIADINIPIIKAVDKIAHLLMYVDMKIVLNHEIIQSLEKLSQTIFKRWFIDFEFPNEQGLPYKSSGEKIVDNELGKIPEGWRIYTLSELTKMFKKNFNPIKTLEIDVAHFSIPAFDSQHYPVIDEVSTIKSNKWIVEDNCVLFSKMNPSTPRVWLPTLDTERLNVCSSEFVVLKSESPSITAFIYNLCKSELFTEYLKANATGSTNSRQRITPDNAMLFNMALDKGVIVEYAKIVEPMMEQIKILARENKGLGELRSILIPKLLSGEIEIPGESVVY